MSKKMSQDVIRELKDLDLRRDLDVIIAAMTRFKKENPDWMTAERNKTITDVALVFEALNSHKEIGIRLMALLYLLHKYGEHIRNWAGKEG